MNKIKIFFIWIIIFFIYLLLFLFKIGWIFSFLLFIFLILFIFSPVGGSIIDLLIIWNSKLKVMKKNEKQQMLEIEKDSNRRDKFSKLLFDYQKIEVPKGSKVALGISGGIDSAVSAFLLKEQGFEVEAFFMRNWDSAFNEETNNILTEEEICEQEEDYKIAKEVCEFLGIKIHKVNFVQEYWDYVFSSFLKDIKKGNTPNPDILCNRFIKFDLFLEYIFKNNPEIKYVSTGHYADIRKKDDKYFLVESFDNTKDQTYFLSEIKKDVLDKIIFPLADFTKKEVKEIAKKINLPNWNKKESMGICFIGKRNFPEFISNYLKEKKGKIIDFDDKEIVGEHIGAHFYTIGQRKGLNLSGFKKPYFVVGKDIKKNEVYVSNKEENFFSNNFLVKNFISLIDNINEYLNKEIEFKVRHSIEKYTGKIKKITIKDNKINLEVISNEQIKFLTPGQEFVAYKDLICLGGGVIK